MEAVFSSLLGNLKLVVNGEAIEQLLFTEDSITEVPNSPLLKEGIIQINQYFSGQRTIFDLPLAPTGTIFQKRVWQELEKINYGITISYQEVANRLGDPKCIRAAARANGQNPIAIIIPCHRVIGTHGEMTGYAGGIWRKKELLQLEGAAVMSQINIF